VVENKVAPSPAVARAAQRRDIRRRLLKFLNRYSFAFAFALTAILLLINLIQDHWNFGWQDELANLAPMAIAAMATAPSIIAQGFDFTISPMMFLTGGLFAAYLIPHGLGGAVAVPIVLVLGAAVGALQGTLVVALRLPPVVVTLGLYFMLDGIDTKLLPNPVSFSGSWVEHLAGSVGPVPGPVFTIGLPILAWLLLGLFPLRKMIYAIGSNPAAAYSSGIRVGGALIAAYTIGGVFAGVGGFAVAGLEQSVNATLSGTYTLLGVAALALGGTSLAGGRGGLVGPLLGAASIYLLGDVLSSLQVNASWLQVMYGCMLIFAVVLQGRLALQRRNGV
jgi:ribose transport system permease protein